MRFTRILPVVLLGAIVVFAARASGQSSQSMRLLSPKPGAVVSGTVPIKVDAPGDLGVSFVVFGIDGDRPLSTNSRPFTCIWDTRGYAEGPHILFIEAYGPGGMVASAGPFQVIVRNEPALARSLVPTRPIASRVIPVAQPRRAVVLPPAGTPQAPGVLLSGRPLPANVRLLDSQAYLPIRTVVEQMGGTVSWDADTRTVTAWCLDREVLLTVGSTVATLDGTRVRLWRAPTIDADRVILPARGCAQLFDLPITWDATRRVIRMGTLRLPAPKPAG